MVLQLCGQTDRIYARMNCIMPVCAPGIREKVEGIGNYPVLSFIVQIRKKHQ